MNFEAAARLLALCRSKQLRITAAESCTGGLLAATLTDVPGSSDVFERGFVTYSNTAKTELLEVEEELLATHGAVSEEVAEAMARGALVHAHAELSAGITGIAGPGGATPTKPVGLVFIAVASRFGRVVVDELIFPGNRTNVREAAVERALQMLYEAAESY